MNPLSRIPNGVRLALYVLYALAAPILTYTTSRGWTGGPEWVLYGGIGTALGLTAASNVNVGGDKVNEADPVFAPVLVGSDPVSAARLEEIVGNPLRDDDEEGYQRARASLRELDQGRCVVPSLRRGDIGSDVAQVQRLLAQHGYELDDDGIYGPQTESAVRDYQRHQGILVDGVAGPQTLQPLGYVSGVRKK
jgi:hypothetical protein